MVARDVPIVCAGVALSPGDIVSGDVDGVVVVPNHVADDAIALALAKVAAENHTREELLQGRRLAEVYSKYGVL